MSKEKESNFRDLEGRNCCYNCKYTQWVHQEGCEKTSTILDYSHCKLYVRKELWSEHAKTSVCDKHNKK